MEQRLSKRIPFRKRIKCGSSHSTLGGYTFNLSANGIGVKADRVFAPATRITIHMYMGDETIRLEGIVMWVSSTLPGILSTMGIKFSSRTDDIKRIYLGRINQISTVNPLDVSV